MTKEFKFNSKDSKECIKDEVEEGSIKDFWPYFILIGIIILVVSAFCSVALIYGYLGLIPLVVPVYIIGVFLCSLIALYLHY